MKRLPLLAVALAPMFLLPLAGRHAPLLPAPTIVTAVQEAVVDAGDLPAHNARPWTVPDFRQGSWTLEGSDQPWGQDPVGGEAGSVMWKDGCAVTAVADVLAYYGVELPDGYGSVNPGALNRWLTDHDGFWPGGDIRWGSVEEASGGALRAGDADEVLAPDSERLDAELADGRPVILQVVGVSGATHYVVATARSGDTYQISDPGGLADTLSGYGNAFYQMILFAPQTATASSR